LLDAGIKSASGSSGKMRRTKAMRAAPTKAVAPFWHTGGLIERYAVPHFSSARLDAVLFLSGARCSG